MKKIIAWSLICAAVLGLSAAVPAPTDPIKVDGKLEEKSWSAAPVYRGFRKIGKLRDQPVQAQTEFRLLADSEAVYVGIKCFEPAMAKVIRDPLYPHWGSEGNTIDVFLSPSGDIEDYYLFEVTAGNGRHAAYYAERGNIQPERYAPDWNSAVYYGENFWSLEIRIPLTAFYMTRNPRWNTQWLVNVARFRSPTRDMRELTSWSELIRDSFHQVKCFRKISGFPVRKAEQDIFLKEIAFQTVSRTADRYRGSLVMEAEVAPAAAGKAELIFTLPDKKTFTTPANLKNGVNRFQLKDIEITKKTPGELRIQAVLKRNGEIVADRFYPCMIEYAPLLVNLTYPSYRDNFYPGMAADHIEGTVKVNLSGMEKIVISLKGKDIPARELTLKPDGKVQSFKLDKLTFPEGASAELHAEIYGPNGKMAETTKKISRPIPPKKGTAVWIDNGRLIINGKPQFPRNLYSVHYRGGRKFQAMFDSDNLYMTPFKLCGVQEWRISTTAAATRPVKPAPEVFEKARKIVKSAQGTNFIVYYISDEPECRSISATYLKYIYDYVRELDPFHPIMTGTRSPRSYLNCADVIAVHPYINPVMINGRREYHRPVATTRNFLRAFSPEKHPEKVAGYVGSMMVSTSDPIHGCPTFAETEATHWSAFANGARITYPYAYHDLGDRPQLYEGFRYINSSVAALEPWLLSNRKPPVSSSFPAEKTDVALWEHDGTLLLAVINLVPEPLSGRVEADALKKFSTLYEFRGSREPELKNGSLELELPPYGCAIYTTKKLQTNLPSRAEVVAKIDAENKARTTRGNLLLHKQDQIELSSGGSTARAKLLDGNTFMLAWQSKRWAKKSFLEISFPNRSPEFKTLQIHGDGVENVAVRVWKFGEWKSPKTASVKRSRGMTRFEFEEPWTTVKIRLDFGPPPPKTPTIELYEIELLK